LDEKDLPAVQGELPESVGPETEETWNRPLEEVEKATILKTLESLKGNKSETSRRLGITRRTLHKKLKKYGVMA
ncbi:MAG: two-component system response regulator, partial [Candidatus Dadabacteria bacterium]|nr:two-component system response regulator [Candidatus Dadabacteria bacterium]